MLRLSANHARRATQRGFTLIELVVVLAILGILLALAVPRYIGVRKRAFKEEIANILAEAKTLSWAYYQEYDLFPDDPTDIALSMPSGTVWASPFVLGGGGSGAFITWRSSGVGGPLVATDTCSVSVSNQGQSDQGCTF